MTESQAINGFKTDQCWLCEADAMDCYDLWPSPMCIVSDGAYGIGGFDGDPPSPSGLREWYRPHVYKWSVAASTATTLWFWNTEIGWASVHPLLEEQGWRYVRCCVWDKDKSHIAGNVNTRTIKQFPCVTEVCVQYVRDQIGTGERIQDWLRNEWLRSALPLGEANTACGVKNAATRKYLTSDGAFYLPPEEMLNRLREYANAHGDPAGRPYFQQPSSHFHPKFQCPFGMTNVWRRPQAFSNERLRDDEGKPLHPNQKPISLMGMIVESCTDRGDVVWEPFGGLFGACLSAVKTGRIAFGAEINHAYYRAGASRIADAVKQIEERLF